MPRPPRAVIVHGLEDALAAAAAAEAEGVPVCLRSAPGAAGYAGPAWFAEVVAAARRAHPGVEIAASLDCGDSPGHVLAALRRGLEMVRFDGPPAMRRRLEALCAAHGARLDPDRGAALDLGRESDPAAACRAWLARVARR